MAGELIQMSENKPTMNATCQQCKEPIHEEAKRCKHCGYEPSDVSTGKWVMVVIGVLLSLTGIGAIIGVPTIIAAFIIERDAANLRPTTHDPT